MLKEEKKKPKEESKVYRYFCRSSHGIVHSKIKPETGTIIGKLKLKKLDIIYTSLIKLKLLKYLQKKLLLKSHYQYLKVISKKLLE